MHQTRYYPAVLTALLLVVLASPAGAKKPEKQPWIEVRSSNFRIYSVWKEDETVELVKNLELLRAAIPALTNAQNTEPPIPTEIFALKSKADFVRFGISSSALGVFTAGLRNNLILLRRSGYFDGRATILHEYAHFVMRNHGQYQYPFWYDEGLAEYFSSAQLNSGSFEVGRFPQELSKPLRFCAWSHISHLISFEPGGRVSPCLAYPQSWALVHYLQTVPGFVQKFSRYLELIESGNGRDEAFEAAFELSTDELNSDLRDYLHTGEFAYYSLPADQLLPDFQYEVSSLSPELMSLKLAGIALANDRPGQAKKWYSIAAGKDELRASAESGLGDVYKFNGKFEAALPHFEEALALAPDDPYIQLDIGKYWHERALAAHDKPTQRDEYLDTARAHYVEARKLDDSVPEVYAVYGETFLIQRAYDKAVEPLEKAFQLLPSSIHIRINLAHAYMGTGRVADAAAHARSVLAWSHSDSKYAQRARALLELLEKVKSQ